MCSRECSSVVYFCPEITKLKELLKDYNVYNFKPTQDILEKYMDGGVAIIDQWICAHARSVHVYTCLVL